MLDIRRQNLNNIETIHLQGILNAETSPLLEEILHELSKQPLPMILLCVENLEYISSAGMGCFIGAIGGIRKKGGDLRFAGMQPRVKRIFTLLDMEDFFSQFDSMEKGLASFSDKK
ncbi:STAS domain-containing protein [Desulfobotulus mexicanus]|uniref:Anti-sigma factor antagonist n=1 Tax=Desulfobotulus mexicanus TaxID=2586642 RepID=A0A5S5ME19_9BACT|nr:STAS domain-containing protein [Desulfobotulus mexicanus]TYT73930.1 STAS domain-containing protein [Desulfobotulus mexicanus]